MDKEEKIRWAFALIILSLTWLLVGSLIGHFLFPKTKIITEYKYYGDQGAKAGAEMGIRCAEKVCPKQDCVCHKDEVPCSITDCQKEDVCNSPSKYACKSGLNSVVLSINVVCESGRIKV